MASFLMFWERKKVQLIYIFDINDFFIFLHTVTSVIPNVTSMTVFCHQAKKPYITKEIFITL